MQAGGTVCSSLEAEGTYSPLIFLCALPIFMNFFYMCSSFRKFRSKSKYNSIVVECLESAYALS